MVSQLDLSGNELCGLDRRGGGTYTAKGITAIADALCVNGSLTKLSLARNELEAEGTKAICEALEQNTTLKELDISGRWGVSNIGGPAGVKHVAKMLGVNGSLTKMWYVSPRTNLSEFGPSFLHPCASDGDCQCSARRSCAKQRTAAAALV